MNATEKLQKEILILDPEAKVEDLKFNQLQAKLKQLEKEIEAKAKAEDKSKDKPAKANKKAKKKKPPYSVPEGKSLTTKRGILTDCEVTADDFDGGEKTLESLVESGHVDKA